MKPRKLLQSKSFKAYATAGALFLALAFCVLIAVRRPADPVSETAADTPAVEAAAPAYRHPLDGLPLVESPASLPRVYAVMIDNSVDAWPVSGTEDAFLVIEAPVEAAIPRLEAFFSADTEVSKIGPVRSARPYFVDWADEFDALYAHVGGSNAALELIGSRGTLDLNEFYNGANFWRATDRSAPHNAYTSSDLLAAAVARAKDRGRAPEPLYGTWTFADAPADSVEDGSAHPANQGISVRFNSDLYAVRWDYDAETRGYLRSQGGRESWTLGGARMAAANVAVVVTDVEVLDAVGRREIRTVGEGKAWVLQDGAAIDATWKKPSVSERLRFYREDGTEIVMRPGTTWIEVVADASDAEIAEN